RLVSAGRAPVPGDDLGGDPPRLALVEGSRPPLLRVDPPPGPGEHEDPTVAELAEVGDRVLRALPLVDAERRQPRQMRLRGPDDDERAGDGDHRHLPDHVLLRGDDDDRLDRAIEAGVDGALELLGQLAVADGSDRREQGGEVVAAGGLLDAGQRPRGPVEEGPDRDHSDESGPARDQGPCGIVATVAEFADGGLDPLPGGRFDSGRTVDDPRYGLVGHLRVGGDLGHARPPVRTLGPAHDASPIAAIVHVASCVSPGSRTRRSVPELKASGGQVIASTATARRSSSGWSGTSAVKICTQGSASGSQLSDTPESAASGPKSSTPVTPPSASMPVIAWSIRCGPIGRAEVKSKAPSANSATGCRHRGSFVSSSTSSTSCAGTRSRH